MSSLVKYTKPETFRRFAPPLLAELLARYPVLLAARGIVLPETADAESMPYKKITELFLSVDEVAEQNSDLYGTIHLVGRLATQAGRGAIVDLAEQRDVVLPPAALANHHDLALWTGLNHPRLLEAAGYRIKMHTSRAYHYYRPVADDVRPLDFAPETVDQFAQALRSYYRGISKGSSIHVLDVEEGDELWLVIRHGGFLERRANIDDESGSTGSICFRDEEYDILIYNRVHGDLKIRHNNDKTLEVLRTDFGKFFFGSVSWFTARETFTLDRLKQPDCGFFSSTLVPGIAAVVLEEVRYMMRGGCDRTVHEKSSNLLYSLGERSSVVPAEALLIDHAKLGFRFEGARAYRSVKISAPNRSNFARESDVFLVEQWLREAGLMRSVGRREAAVA